MFVYKGLIARHITFKYALNSIPAMKYSGGLVKKERELIFKLFIDKTRLKFNEIEKAIKIRSNMVSYHLEKMQEEGLIEKNEDSYQLTKEAEKYIPIVPHITGEKLSPLPVVLVALINKEDNKILLIKRNNRPYQNYWSLIGGKMLHEESFEETSKRLIQTKTRLDAEFISINSVLHERVEDDIIKHSFILFFTKMGTEETELKFSRYGELRWFNIEDIDEEDIIPSDLWLIKNKLNETIDVRSAGMNDNKGSLNSFKVND